MKKKLTRICLILGTIYYISALVYLHTLGISPITIFFAWLISLVFSFAFAFGERGIKTSLFSDIKEDFKSPVYKLERNNWGEKVVSKYTVEYITWDDGWAIFFPYISIFKFRQYYLEDSVCVYERVHGEILEGIVSIEAVYLREKMVNEKQYFDEVAAEKIKKDKFREVNKEYYNNFKR